MFSTNSTQVTDFNPPGAIPCSVQPVGEATPANSISWEKVKEIAAF
ncbi:MAG: hypothetical protein K0S74_1897 [Chlamydiales bacterium]|jgi:hypothetical protein|nr:hypothetical protein [Chlamydiales bacterium]